jgi:RNA polymerase-binding transcription factor DksA
MQNKQPAKEQLMRRRDEINEQLNRTQNDLRIELERDPEDQAIQVEQDEVSITMENNLRKELADIEEKLAESGEK